MNYIIMCGGKYDFTETPKQLWKLPNGDVIVERTIRLLSQLIGPDDSIYISANNDKFDNLGVPVLKHENSYHVDKNKKMTGDWVDAFYPTVYPTCYLFGDVVFTKTALRKIVKHKTTDIDFFASSPPFALNYPKPWAEPFAVKVVDTSNFFKSVFATKVLHKDGRFNREPIMWELWQVINKAPLNEIDYNSYIAINDRTCDVDYVEDLQNFKGFRKVC